MTINIHTLTSHTILYVARHTAKPCTTNILHRIGVARSARRVIHTHTHNLSPREWESNSIICRNKYQTTPFPFPYQYRSYFFFRLLFLSIIIITIIIIIITIFCSYFCVFSFALILLLIRDLYVYFSWSRNSVFLIADCDAVATLIYSFFTIFVERWLLLLPFFMLSCLSGKIHYTRTRWNCEQK